MLKVELVIERKTFENDKGEEVEYIEGIAEVAGEKIRFAPKKDDKKLLDYLLGKPEKAKGDK